MPIAGDLSNVPLPQVLEMLQQQGRAGLLTIKTSLKETTLYFDGTGVRLFSVNGQKAMRIGDVLLEHERITEFQLKHALERQAESKVRLGEILTELGLVTADEIESAIKTQAEEEIFEIFSLREGEFRFAERELAEQEYRPDPSAPDHLFGVDWLVGEVARRVEEWQRLAADFRGDADVFVVPPETRTASLAEIADGGPKRLAELLNGSNTIGDLVHRLLLPRYKIYRTLAELVRDGHARQATPDELRETAARLRESKQVKQAVKLLEHAFGIDPSSKVVVQELAELHEAVGDKKRAGGFYKALADIHFNSGDPDHGAILCQKVAEFLPNDPYPHERLVEHNIARDQRERALDSARILLRLYQHDGEIDRASELCRSFLEMFPEDIGLHERMVNLHLAAGREMEAVGEYEAMADLVAADPTINPASKDKQRLETFQKILRIDGSREDIRKLVDTLSGTTGEMAANKKKKARRTLSLVAGLAVLVAGAYGGLEFQARSAMRALKDSPVVDTEIALGGAISRWNEFQTSYAWSSIQGEAQAEIDRLTLKLGALRAERKAREQRLNDDVIEAERRFVAGELDAAESLADDVLKRDGGGLFGARARTIRGKIDAQRLREAENRARAEIDAAAAEETKATAQSLLESQRILVGLGSLRDAHLLDARDTALERVVRKLRALFLTQARERFADGKRARTDDDLKEAEKHWQIALANLRQEVLRGVADADVLRADVQGEYDKLVRYLKDAARIHQLSVRAEEAGQLEEALRLVNRLLRDFPVAPMVADGSLRAAMRIVSDPAGATVRLGEAVAGTTPCVVRYPPGERVQFDVELRGFKPQRIEGNGTQHTVTLPLEKTWFEQIKIGGDVVATPLLVGDRLIVGGRTQRLHGLDLGGAPGAGWVYDLKSLGEVRATPTSAGGRVFVVATNNDTVHALTIAEGAEPVAAWQSQRLEVPPRGRVLANADGSSLLLLGRGGRLWSFDPGTGAHSTVAELGYEPLGEAARTGDRLWIAGDDGQLHVVNAADGDEIAAIRLPSRAGSGPVAHGGTVYVPAGRAVWVFNADAAAEVLTGGGRVFDGADGDISALAVTDGRCVAVTLARTVVEWDPAGTSSGNGSGVAPRWQKLTDATGLGVPAVGGDRIVFGSRAGRVICLQGRDGEVLWAIDLPGPVRAAPVIWRDRVLVPCEDSHLYSVVR